MKKGLLKSEKMGNYEKEQGFASYKTIVDYFNNRVEITDNKKITEEEVFIVWSCKTLQNNKALVSTTISDGMYYELTYNGDKQELYLDAYKKWENKCIKVGE